MSKLSLTELEKIKNDMEKYAKSERQFLEANFPYYKDFHYNNGEFYFHISYSGIHKNTTLTKLNDLWEIKIINRLPTPGNPLDSKKKYQINSICDMIVRYEKRIREVDKEILRLKLGDNFWGKKKINLSKEIKEFAEINNFPKHTTLPANHLTKLYEHLDRRRIPYKESSVKRILDRYDYSKPQRNK